MDADADADDDASAAAAACAGAGAGAAGVDGGGGGGAASACASRRKVLHLWMILPQTRPCLDSVTINSLHFQLTALTKVKQKNLVMLQHILVII